MKLSHLSSQMNVISYQDSFFEDKQHTLQLYIYIYDVSISDISHTFTKDMLLK